MEKLKAFAGYQAVQSVAREQLPVGGYVAKILAVKMQETSFGTQRMVFQVEIAEGEFKDFYRKDYEARKGGQYEAKYRGVYSINYPSGDGSERDGWAINRFNRTMGAIEGSNDGYTWDWNLIGLKGKGVGIIIRECEFNDVTFTEIGTFTTVDAIRNGKFRPMKKRVTSSNEQTPIVDSAPQSFTPIDDEDIPF